jgi:hypothetical protein
LPKTSLVLSLPKEIGRFDDQQTKGEIETQDSSSSLDLSDAETLLKMEHLYTLEKTLKEKENECEALQALVLKLEKEKAELKGTLTAVKEEGVPTECFRSSFFIFSSFFQEKERKVIHDAYLDQGLHLTEALRKKKEQEDELQDLRDLLETFREEMLSHVDQAASLEEELKDSKIELGLTKTKLFELEAEVDSFFSYFREYSPIFKTDYSVIGTPLHR